MSKYFVECICKYIVKKYPTEERQYAVFKNLGFRIFSHDSVDLHIKDAVVWCVVGVVLVSSILTVPLINILDFYTPEDPSRFILQERFLPWMTGSVVAFLIAIFIGVIAKKIPDVQQRMGSFKYSLKKKSENS